MVGRHDQIRLSVCVQPISEDDVDRISTLLRVLVDRLPLMADVFEQRCRQALSAMLGAKAEEDKLSQKVCCHYYTV